MAEDTKRTEDERAKGEQTRSEDNKGAATKETNKASGHTPLPEVNFETFIISLSTSALVHLGHLPEPGGDKIKMDLDLARHTIDTLAMLQEKTRGNLSEEEKSLLENILFDLRMKYVKVAS